MADYIEMENEETSQDVKFMDIVYTTLRHWPWLLASVVLCVGLAVFYVLRSQPVYSRAASIVIKEDSKGNSIASDINAFADMGFVQSKSNINDEVNKLNSPDVMTEVVKRLGLDMTYEIPGTFHRNVVYGSTLPVYAQFPSLLEEEGASATFKVSTDGTYTISDIVREDEDMAFEQALPVPLDSTITTPLGAVTLKKTDYYRPGEEYTIYVKKAQLSAAAKAYLKATNISRENEKSNTITIGVKDKVAQRAEDLISAIISVYNEIWMENRNQIAVSTSNFINERLQSLEHELGSVDQDISSYQSEHLIPDVQQSARMYMEENQAANAQILDLNNQLQMTRYMRDFLADANNRNQVLPANTGIGSASIEKQISDYNIIQMERNQYAANSSEAHPKVMALDVQIANMRSAILSAIDNQIIALNTQIRNLQSTKSKTTAQIAANPTQAKYLLSVERQQKVKEALYLFLLQKREENELSQAFTAYNTQIIARPNGPKKPVAPRRLMIVAIAFIFGFMLPFGITFCIETLNTKVRGRKDLDKLTVPFLGEIPMAGKNEQHGSKDFIAVKQGCRNVVNEAFRVLRTNVGFVSSKDGDSTVIMLTSFNAGSGKTFVAVNLALSLAIRGRRTIVIDGDLRHGSTSVAVDSPQKGLADYLVGKVSDLSDVIVTSSDSPNMDIIPVGTFPPNPTELLESDLFPSMIAELRKKYEYIFIDCPPIEMMADAQIVEQYADRVIFVVRAGLLDRSMLPELEKIYQAKKFKNMGLVLNGTTQSAMRYKYGYGYGYSDYASYNNE